MQRFRGHYVTSVFSIIFAVGYAIAQDLKLTAEVLNRLNRKVSDAEYFYEARLPGEAVAVNDIHTHPSEPRTLRIGMVFNF